MSRLNNGGCGSCGDILPQGYYRSNTDINTIECNKKILSITKVGDNVVIMYDDCSYGTAPIDVVAEEAFNGKKMEELQKQNKQLLQRVTALENKPDKDTIYDDRALSARVSNLETNTVKKSELVTIENLEGTRDLFKAFPL